MTSSNKKSAGQTAFDAHIPDTLLSEPLDYMFADHCRQAELCRTLLDLADEPAPIKIAPEQAEAILHCVETDLRLHIADEEVDLFPRLRVRVRPDDHFMDILNILDLEHARDHDLSMPVRAGLKALSQGRQPDDITAFCRAAGTLAESHLSHLNWENVVVLALARKRLNADDLKAIGRAMAKRRAIDFPND